MEKASPLDALHHQYLKTQLQICFRCDSNLIEVCTFTPEEIKIKTISKYHFCSYNYNLPAHLNSYTIFVRWKKGKAIEKEPSPYLRLTQNIDFELSSNAVAYSISTLRSTQTKIDNVFSFGLCVARVKAIVASPNISILKLEEPIWCVSFQSCENSSFKAKKNTSLDILPHTYAQDRNNKSKTSRTKTKGIFLFVLHFIHAIFNSICQINQRIPRTFPDYKKEHKTSHHCSFHRTWFHKDIKFLLLTYIIFSSLLVSTRCSIPKLNHTTGNSCELDVPLS